MGNMRIITGSTGTTHVTSDDDRGLNAAIFSNDSVVLDAGEKFGYTVVDNNTIRIADGDLLLQGCHARINYGLTEDVTIDTGALGKYRVDLITARYEMDQNTGYESVTLHVIKGTQSSSAYVTPDYEEGSIREGDLVVDFPLYMVKLDGINIDSVTALFGVANSVQTINTNLTQIQIVFPVSGWESSSVNEDYPYANTITVSELGPDEYRGALIPYDDSAFLDEEEQGINANLLRNGTSVTCYASEVPTHTITFILGRL